METFSKFVLNSGLFSQTENLSVGTISWNDNTIYVLLYYCRLPTLSSKMKDLNDPHQNQAVQFISGHTAHQNTGRGPMLVLGPFGTGKTHTLATAVQCALQNQPKSKILICTQTNRYFFRNHSKSSQLFSCDKANLPNYITHQCHTVVIFTVSVSSFCIP